MTHEVFDDADLTVINIWGTFCGPCIQEMPDLGASLAGDLLAYAFEEIDFYSIARSYLADFHDFRGRKK